MKMNNKFKILVVEDETNIRAFLCALLTSKGYQTLEADCCKDALMMFRSYSPDLTILDLGLPDGDGCDFIRDVRSHSQSPIIVLSARSEETDKVEALDLGANDYITKPFGAEELLARVRGALRTSLFIADTGVTSRECFVLRDMKIDFDSRRFYLRGEEIKLTQTEYNIMALLSAHAGKMLTYSAIINAVWGSNDIGAIKKLQVNMANIRKKLGIRPGDEGYIVNELGVGYRMQNE